MRGCHEELVSEYFGLYRCGNWLHIVLYFVVVVSSRRPKILVGVDMKYPKDIDHSTWDKMVYHACHTLILLFFVAMVCIVVMMIKDVV